MRPNAEKDTAKTQRSPGIPGFLWTVFLLPAVAVASISFPARHDHTIGSCRGTLVFGGAEIRYDSARHAARWPYDEVQELRLADDGRVRLLSYQDGTRWQLGADRAFNFDVDGNLKELVALLVGRLDQRLVVGFAETPGKILAEFPAKHLRPIRGDDAVLIFGEETVVFRSEEKGESRTWRYADIESINRLDSYHLTITTYERRKFHYATRRAFNFQLKRPMGDDTYNTLWRRLNRPRDLDVLDKLRADVENKTDELAPSPPSLETQAEGAFSEATELPRAPDSPVEPPQSASAAPPSTILLSGDPQLRVIARVLREEGLPTEFIGVAKVESGLNRFALSPKNARGLWQLIPETARRFGLRVDAHADERTDPEKSTRAGARYLKQLYGLFGDWGLALAGYNAGERRVQSAIARTGTRDFHRLANLLPVETQSYVTAVLGTLARGGGSPQWPLYRSPQSLWEAGPGRGYRVFAPAALFTENQGRQGDEL